MTKTNLMSEMSVANFIDTVFIDQTGKLARDFPYIAFLVMGTGIEFLGRCIHPEVSDWNQEQFSRKSFEYAVNNIEAFKGYRSFIGKKAEFDLYGFLRCGLSHAGAPVYQITISSKEEMEHLAIHTEGRRLNLKCEDFYADFRAACGEVKTKKYDEGDKMNAPFLAVPDAAKVPPEDQPVITNSGENLEASGKPGV